MSLILSGTDGLSDVDGTAATPAIRGTDTNTGIFFPAADTVAASVGGTEGLRLTTTGLGVATSTPNSIGGNSNARYFGLAGDGTLSSADGRVILSNPRAYASIVANSTTAGRIYFQLPNASTGTTNEAAFIDSIASGSGGTSGYGIDIRFGPKADNGSANERMRLDQAGNLGLGVTPSGWGTNFRALELASAGLMSNVAGGSFFFMNNAYYNGTNWIYKYTAAASRYDQSSGVHAWFTAPSGTAGNAISFTQAMTLDASGKLAIGSTNVYDGAMLSITTPSQTFSFIADGGTTSNKSRGGFYHPSANVFALNVDGASGVLAFTQNATERARITSGGDLLVNRTSTLGTAKFVVEADTTTANPMTVSNSRSTAATDYSILFYRNASLVGSVQTSLTATSYVTSSDYRLKENIQPMTGALAKVAALKPVTYKWKATGGEADGFIAHELAEVCPQAVTGDKDAMDSEGRPVYQGIDTSFLVATLTAAIQEQQAIIESLTARITALEAK